MIFTRAPCLEDMRKTLLLLLSVALLGVGAFGVAVVRADDSGGGSQTAACPSDQPSTGDRSDDGGDRVAQAAEDQPGSEADDSEHGSGADDHLDGRGGDDELDGNEGDDELCGDQGDDHLRGGAGDDDLDGGPGNDKLVGGTGRDHERGDGGSDDLIGGAGADVLSGGAGRDHIEGDAGNDRINARDGRRDLVNCGPGQDTVRADKADAVARNCEHVSR